MGFAESIPIYIKNANSLCYFQRNKSLAQTLNNCIRDLANPIRLIKKLAKLNTNAPLRSLFHIIFLKASAMITSFLATWGFVIFILTIQLFDAVK